MRLQLLLVVLVGTYCFSQQAPQIPIAPVPADPHELITGVVKVLDETDQRATVLGLIERARQNSDLHAPAGHPYNLKVSFEASGNVSQTGSGHMEEIWVQPYQWRWTASLGSYTVTRIMAGRMYDDNPSFLPLRLHMVRGTLLWPIHTGPNELMRIAPGNWNGSPVLCVLSSNPRFEASKTTGRNWEESEFCIDAKSGLLQTYSVAPGLYAVYDSKMQRDFTRAFCRARFRSTSPAAWFSPFMSIASPTQERSIPSSSLPLQRCSHNRQVRSSPAVSIGWRPGASLLCLPTA